ncbi:DUF2515 domain-containing protein [Metabacillus idriensis]|uniref:DUF2515 family protein n=1 Tax=Metabacillus idriensis TaxID=324768 RepID=UPI00091B3BAF|nr:DUF2515 family protein [Metabacillus idriensis]MCM3595957.1 DUF2515 domain-containing protein [Metabacillus idriensis]OHR69807.1 hypothetical protein HMPREF3291_07625 [Bacillus sp. HMSC76G11]
MKTLPLFKKKALPVLLPNAEKVNLEKTLSESLEMKSPLVLYGEDRLAVQEIKAQTAALNRNNLTRTEAYLAFYIKHPEIHWAFLAHMVSRNGGYSMTDLKNGLVGQFLPEKEMAAIFQFLETANALIFHDAYPQLLLYEKSLLSGRPLFHLLPALNVSRFMKPMWELFFKKRQSDVLTLALITNEQNYVEKQLVSNSSILKTFPYAVQEKCGLTKVVFPYKKHFYDTKYSLAGTEVENFIKPEARIKIGKTLYQTLFHPAVFKEALFFSKYTPHTGSRSDYWPHLFTPNKEKLKIQSPKLQEVWEDVPHPFQRYSDWLLNTEQISEFDAFQQTGIYKDMTKNVKMDLLKLGSLQLFTKKIL